MNKKELLARCKELGIEKCSSKNKSQLIELINGKTVESVTDIVTDTEPKHNLLSLLNNLIQQHNVKYVSEYLNLSPGTILRWIELKDVPSNYEFDLLKLSNIHIQYALYSSKQKDQFFTPIPTAKYCFELFCNEIHKYGDNETDYKYIEPSAGDGNFLQVLPPNTIAFDIDPKHESILEQDYLDWKPEVNHGKLVVFGNPPFGLRGHMALKFINHSYEFADYVSFILPQLFESDGKGVPRKRVKGYHLIYSVKLDSSFYEPNKNEIKINTIFQIWSKHHQNDMYDIMEYTNHPIMKIYSMSDGGTIATTRNKNRIGTCDVYIPSTCFGKENMKCYFDFEELPGRKGYGIVFFDNKPERISQMLNIKWEDVAFLSTNSAYNLRSSQIYSLF